MRQYRANPVMESVTTMQNKLETIKLLSSFVIGDGSLTKEGNLIVGQISEHEDYLMWQKSIIERVVPCSVYKQPEQVDKRGFNKKEFWQIRSKQHPLFRTLFERWYHFGRKTISIHDVKNFGWKEMAVWFMDDGSAPYYVAEERRRGNMMLCTHSFSEAENKVLQRIIYENFSLPFDVRKNGKYYFLFLRKKFSNQFYDGVSPYIFDSFKYKLRTISPASAGGDIV